MMGESNGAGIFVPTENVDSDGRPANQRRYPDVQVATGNTNTELAQIGAKVDQIKKWTINTFKNTKQQVFEHMGKVDRTVDPEFDAECESLRELHRRYGVVVASAQAFSNVFEQLSIAEKTLAESLYQLSLKEQSVKTQCSLVGDSLRKVTEHASGLDKCVKYFLSSMHTIHEKTITDTLDTISTADLARVEFDVCRHDLSTLQSNPSAAPSQIVAAKEKLDAFRDKYERLKGDVRVKLRLLEENRVKVLSVQLTSLHTALSAYFSGNAQQLAVSVDELKALVPDGTSFLQ